MDKDTITVTFKVDKDLVPSIKEHIILDVISRINDNATYVTDVKYNNKVFYHIDENTFRCTCNKIQELM